MEREKDLPPSVSSKKFFVLLLSPRGGKEGEERSLEFGTWEFKRAICR
jgi:hypothetical protein